MIECRKCRALEFISSGVKHGVIMDIQMSEKKFNCAFGNKIILIDGKPCCENCNDKTIRIKKQHHYST